MKALLKLLITISFNRTDEPLPLNRMKIFKQVVVCSFFFSRDTQMPQTLLLVPGIYRAHEDILTMSDRSLPAMIANLKWGGVWCSIPSLCSSVWHIAQKIIPFSWLSVSDALLLTLKWPILLNHMSPIGINFVFQPKQLGQLILVLSKHQPLDPRSNIDPLKTKGL